MVSKLKQNRGLVLVTVTILSILVIVLGNQPILAFISN